MNRVTETLTRKIGPLPLWVWVVLGVVAFYAWRRYSASRAPSTDTGTTDTSGGDLSSLPVGGVAPSGFDGMGGVAEGNGLGLLGDIMGEVRKQGQRTRRVVRKRTRPPASKSRRRPPGYRTPPRKAGSPSPNVPPSWFSNPWGIK